MISAPTVSVVDDDEQVRESLAALVHSMNYDVKCYASGQEFLEKYSDSGPGCVVLDLKMPRQSGLEVLEEMAARKLDVPVIMISGHGDISAAVSAMKLGSVDFFEKPYRGAALMDSVRKAIDRDIQHRQESAQKQQLLANYKTLTQVERDVLRLTAVGKPDKAIALKLDLSLRTIQLRRASTMQKLHAGSRAELIRIAQTLEQMGEQL